MKILLTGATGLIGKEVGKLLVSEGHEVIAMTRNAKRARIELPFPCRIVEWAGGGVAFSEETLKAIEKDKLIKCEHKSFSGFTIHNLFEFFMVFVVLCGIAGLILAFLSPKLKKMMHGVN